VPLAAAQGPANLQALTSKPMLYVANVDEGTDEPPAELAAHAGDSPCIAVSARIEAELAELPAEEAGEMRTELGIDQSGLARLVRAAYDLLDLITFFTAHLGAEARARALPKEPPRGTPRAAFTATSRPASCAPRSSAGASSSTRGDMRMRGSAACCERRGGITSCETAT